MRRSCAFQTAPLGVFNLKLICKKNWVWQMVTMQDLGLAYRKAKVDLFYSSHPCLSEIAAYEEYLHDNLQNLKDRIESDDETWVSSSDFIGSWTVATKTVNMSQWRKYREEHGNGLIFSSPLDEWRHACSLLAEQETPVQPEAEFRVMAQCSIDFHVLSTLWLLKVGEKFDEKLTGCAYGNRLRRSKKTNKINPLSLGSFTPYLKPFRDWRDKGIETMRSSLEKGKNIVAITADVTSFYHELNPSFLLEPVFMREVLGHELSEADMKLHRLFIHALQAWAKETPIQKGLPVGLPASAVVANMALIELDRLVEEQVVPLYYGRYVDDILLVMENGSDFKSAAQIWEWLFARSNGKLDWKDDQKKEISFKSSYLNILGHESQIRFSNSKNKVFMMSGEPGQTLVNAIVSEIRERSSEWRAMPRLPLSADQVGSSLVVATQSDGEVADNLRKADALTMRRAGFAMKLRDVEAYERDLHPEAWTEHRQAFLRAFRQHVLVLPQFFDLAVYLPRVVRLATACEDFAELRKILKSLEELSRQVEDCCSIAIKAAPEDFQLTSSWKLNLLDRWGKQLFSSVRESIAAAFPPQLTKLGRQEWAEHMKDYRPPSRAKQAAAWSLSAKEWQKTQAWLFSCDLAHMPFRFIGLPAEVVSRRGIPAKKTVSKCEEASDMLPSSVISGTQLVSRLIKLKGLSNGLVFSTRPFSMAELFLLSRDVFEKAGQERLQEIVLALRGFRPEATLPLLDKNNVLRVSSSELPPKIGIAVSSWETREDSFIAAVTKSPDPDRERYTRLNRLLDSVISQPQASRYLILPELSLPARWFIRIARKLQGRGISLISGIEYLHARKSLVRNQVWASLTHDGFGFPSLMIYRQDKQRPAFHEEAELHRLAGLKMKPEANSTWKTPPIIQHGDFRFSMIVCSELTNIGYRTALRGQVDALFVPEWNKDIETFNALVESAALDMHAYVIQCNHRQFGDSRIRAPFKESWKRDILRVKGGIADYCVVGQIDTRSLRRFQSSHRSPSKHFKPVPDGFQINHERKVLPS